MMHNRLDSVLSRNRKHLVRDLALAAFLPMFMLFSGMAVGAQLPALNAAPQAFELADTATGSAADEAAQLALEESELETAPQGA